MGRGMECRKEGRREGKGRRREGGMGKGRRREGGRGGGGREGTVCILGQLQ